MPQQLQLDGVVEIRQPDDQEFRLLQRSYAQLDEALRLVRNELGQARAENERLQHSMNNLRQTLTPLHRALALVFGEIEAGAGPEHAYTGKSPIREAKAQIWESWKTRLGGMQAKAIDALLGQDMTRTQLRIAVGCGSTSITDVIYKLNKAGLIEKNGSVISLKKI